MKVNKLHEKVTYLYNTCRYDARTSLLLNSDFSIPIITIIDDHGEIVH